MSKSVFGNFTCTKDCKPRWKNGKGSFEGWKIKLCSRHQIIHEMTKIVDENAETDAIRREIKSDQEWLKE